MDWTMLTAALVFFTLIAFGVLAFISKRKTQARMENDSAPKSTLAKDVPSRGKPADV